MPLQSSLAAGGEEALGRLAGAPFRPVGQPRLLLAGLGLGFSLAAAREALPQKRARFVVAEPLAELPGWHRTHLGDLHPGQMADGRVVVDLRPLHEALDRDPGSLHAILVDLEGGTDLTNLLDRQQLPRPTFLSAALAALKDGGLLAIRSASSGKGFEQRLCRAGLEVTRESAFPTNKGRPRRRSCIWLARKGTYQPLERGSQH